MPEPQVEELPWEFQRLKQYGDLKLRSNFPHGLAPMVAVMTEAFPGIADNERAYRRRLTAELDSALSRERVSLWILRPPIPSSTLSAEQIWSHINEGLDLVLDTPGDDGPQAVIGFAETAPKATELALLYPFASVVILLVPSSAENLENWEIEWRRLQTATSKFLRVLVLESSCNQFTAGLVRTGTAVDVLPAHDRWLVKRGNGVCEGVSEQPSVSTDLIATIVSWLMDHIHYRT